MPSLHSLIERGRRAEFEALLARHPEQLEALNESGDRPLHIAAWQNRVVMLQRLIELGADENARGDGGFAPLHYAAKHGALASARGLVGAGTDLNARDDGDFWPIHHALRGREPSCAEVASLLERAGATLDLSCHVMRGDEDKVRQMIARNPDAIRQGPLARDLVYDAVLWISCQTMGINGQRSDQIARQHLGSVAALLDAHADVNDWKWSGESALQLARTSRIPLVTQLLVERGAKATF